MLTCSQAQAALCMASVILLVVGGPAAAQIAVRGRVIDERGQPVSGATITSTRSRIRATSLADGRFSLVLPPGPAPIKAQHLGFLPDERMVVVTEPFDTLTLTLRSFPALLKGITVEAPFAPPQSQTMTAATVRQVPALLEADVFRSLILLPGVSQPNDLRGRIHLAGGASDETGVRLDGHPLQDPFHLFGLLGAFNVGALDRATVLIGHVPLEAAGHLSGVVDLESRSPSDSGGEATLSIVTASATVERRLPKGFDVLASARTSYLKAVAGLVFSDAELGRGNVPLYDARDAVIRIGRSTASGARWEALAFTTQDVFENGRLAGRAGYEPLEWGESLVGLRSSIPIGRWIVTGRTSLNHATISLDERAVKTDGDHIDVRRDIYTGTVVARLTTTKGEMEVGATVDRRTYDQEWQVSEANTDVFSPRTPLAFARDASLGTSAIFASARFGVGSRASIRPGGRLWRVGQHFYFAPQILVSDNLSETMGAELSLERRHQFDAELEEPIEGTVGTPRFPLDRPRIANVIDGAIVWKPGTPRGSKEVRANVFVKAYERDVHLGALAVGVRADAAAADFPAFESRRAATRGFGLAAKGAWASGIAAQVSYTYMATRDRIDSVWAPRDGDMPHSFVAFTSVPLKWRFSLTTALQMHSGAAITPVAARIFVPESFGSRIDAPRARYLPADRNSLRLDPYRRLDVGLRKSWHPHKTETTLSIQILNLLFRQNPRGIVWESYYSYLYQGKDDARAKATSGVAGLPILPSIGLEVRW